MILWMEWPAMSTILKWNERRNIISLCSAWREARFLRMHNAIHRESEQSNVGFSLKRAHEAWATIKMQSGVLSNVRIRVWMNEGAKIDIQWRVHFCDVCSTNWVCAFKRHECHRMNTRQVGDSLQCNILTAAHMFSADKCIHNRHSHSQSQSDRRYTDQPNNKWKSFRVCVCVLIARSSSNRRSCNFLSIHI